MSRSSVRPRAVIASALAVLFAVTLAACSPTGGASGTLRVLAGEATVDGSAVTAELRVEPGEVVETSGSGALVEIQWADGAFTRLAEDTRFVIGQADSRGTLETGTVWNAVGSAASGYTIDTQRGAVVGSADTTFAVRCDDGCDGVVATGSVRVDDAQAVAPATFVVGAGDIQPANWDAVYGDAFALTNSARDEQAGFASPAQAWGSRAPALGSLDGFFEGPGQNLTQECTGWAEECARVQSTIFDYDGTSDFTFTADCAGTLPCTPAIEFEVTATDGGTRTTTYPLVFDGTSYTLDQVLNEKAYCVFQDGRPDEGRWTNSIRGTFTPTAGEVRDGAWVVTEMDAQLASDLVLVEATTDPTCAEFEYEWINERSATLALVTSNASAIGAIPVDAAPVRPVAGPARPTVLSDLRTPAEAIPTLDQLYLLAGGILVLVLVLGYPAFLLSRVVSDRYDQIAGRRAAARQERIDRRPVARIILLLLGLIVAALITAGLDPSFGAEFVPVLADPGSLGGAATAFAMNLGSWRLVLTALAAFVVFIGLGSLVVRLVGLRLAPGIRMPLQFRWGSLLILAAGVVVSRVLDINPGIIFGLVAGLVIADSIPKAARGKLMFVSAGFAIVVGIAAWVGFAFVSPLAAADPTDVALVAGSEALSALTLEAVSTMPLAFLPLMGLDGGTLRAWRIAAWAFVYAIGVALFVLILVSMPGSWVEIQGDIVRWLIGFGAFTVIAIAIWGIHEGLKRRSAKKAATLDAVVDDGENPRDQ